MVHRRLLVTLLMSSLMVGVVAAPAVADDFDDFPESPEPGILIFEDSFFDTDVNPCTGVPFPVEIFLKAYDQGGGVVLEVYTTTFTTPDGFSGSAMLWVLLDFSLLPGDPVLDSFFFGEAENDETDQSFVAFGPFPPIGATGICFDDDGDDDDGDDDDGDDDD